MNKTKTGPPGEQLSEDGSKSRNLRSQWNLRHGNLFQIIKSTLDTTIIGEDMNKLTIFLVILSAKVLQHPLGCIIRGRLSTGRYIMTEVAKYFPKVEILPQEKSQLFSTEYGVIACDDFSYSGLMGLSKNQQNTFDGKVILVGRLKMENHVLECIQDLRRKGEFIRTISEDTLKLRGHPAFVTSNPSLFDDAEYLSSVFTLRIDDSREQTQAIWHYECEKAASVRFEDVIEERITLIRKMIASLKKYPILNPHVSLITEYLKTNFHQVGESRHVTQLLLRMTEVIASLFQYQRLKFLCPRNGKTYVVAKITDVLNAITLVEYVLKKEITTELKKEDKILADIKDEFGSKPFTPQDLSDHLDIPSSTARDHLNMLHRRKKVSKDETQRPFHYQLEAPLESGRIEAARNLKESFRNSSLILACFSERGKSLFRNSQRLITLWEFMRVSDVDPAELLPLANGRSKKN